MIPIFRGKIEKGRVILDYPEKYVVYLSKLEGERVELTVRKRQTLRSTQSNRYYWGVVIPIIADAIGYEKDECHQALKIKFLGEKDDEDLIRVKSTSKLSVDEFTQYVNQTVRWAAAFLGVFIPDASSMEY